MPSLREIREELAEALESLAEDVEAKCPRAEPSLPYRLTELMLIVKEGLKPESRWQMGPHGDADDLCYDCAADLQKIAHRIEQAQTGERMTKITEYGNVESDGARTCMLCRALLDYNLTTAGLYSEVHEASNRMKRLKDENEALRIGPEDSYELQELFYGLQEMMLSGDEVGKDGLRGVRDLVGAVRNRMGAEAEGQKA